MDVKVRACPVFNLKIMGGYEIIYMQKLCPVEAREGNVIMSFGKFATRCDR